ncbi:molybdopterin-dependent oxidoreductase [Pseudolysinimonas yzui]|uniref:Putative oxidoreductase n=1 Tax=Pseudolysinimonas yzui TaxID=2708254 RepID=A0A8J3GSR0_9MICO|nr:molybdopterin-dependent oxidoreductase [Pseudolysinimonas yzui]GHF26709.1 putative oxidoreductase [Pseudolysinimonas yzui]
MADRRTRAWLFPAIAGVAAVAFGLGVAELVAGLLAPRASPLLVVGALLIDLAPPWAKDAAIALFGTADKVALLVGIGLVLLVLAAAAGVLQSRNPLLARLLIAAGGVFGIVAAVTRAGASVVDAVPATVATVAATLVLTALLGQLPAPQPREGDLSRRRFLTWAGGVGAVGALAAIGGYALASGARVVTAVRETFALPQPEVAAAPVPAGAELDVDGLTPVITPNADFYRIDTALQVPNLDPAQWSLRIHGLVENEVELTWDELIALPLEESYTTLMCVSNPVGGDLVGTALWLGYPIRELLARAKPTSGADMVLSVSSDGFTASSPIEALTDDRNAILAVGMNGEPLPLEHGFPVRMVVPGLYGYVSATKWVTELKVTRFDEARGYWTDRGWSARGPVKISSRIDVPRGQVAVGEVVVAGVAWHQHTGIAAVEVSVDDGPWRDAELASAISDDTWVQWRYVWDAAPGDHVLKVRATSADGEVQTADLAGVAPDGATGHHTVSVSVVE